VQSTTPPPEVAQKLPKLPPGWKAHRDRSVGYAIGIPPAWQLQGHGGKVLIRSPDHLVALTLAVDRNGAALELPTRQFATRALAALPGFRARLQPAKPKQFEGTPLDAVETTATGTTKRGKLKERATVVVLRQDAVVNYTVAIVANAERGSAAIDRAFALKMVKTLRDQPVETLAAP
jgi:hypothetical protein